MRDKMTTINTGSENVRWDLSLMYSGLDDPQLDADLDTLVQMMKDFNIVHKGNLSKSLGQAIIDLSNITMLKNKTVYLGLRQSINVSDPAIKSKIADAERKISMAKGEYMTFFDIELVTISNEVLAGLYVDDSIVVKHRPWIEHLRVFKPHLLTEPVESALTKYSPFGSDAWGEFFNELEADLEFELNGKKLTLTELLHGLTDSKDTDERSMALTAINRGLEGPFIKYSAQTLYMVAGSGAVGDKERFYSHPMESVNKENHIPDSVVDMLHKVVTDVAGPLTKRYYRLKAAHLGLKTLRWSDRNAPMPFADTTLMPFDNAMKIVSEAYRSFSPTLAGLIQECIEAKRIDASVTKGRRGGAFISSVVLPGNNPVSFTFLNYMGSSRDAMTLAHELGHGVHGLLSGKAQGPLMSDTPIPYCEFASTFGEMTTYNFLKKSLANKNDTESRLALVMSKLDDTINTVVRQIGFSNFERRLHGMDASYTHWNEPKKLSSKDLDELWLETLKPLYGEDGEVFTYKNAEHLWAYINHFHRPFYVYGYAFGDLLTRSLYAEQSRLGGRFEQLYLDALSSGGTKNVVELLKPFDLDPTKEEFWIKGVKVGLGAMLEEAEELSRKMGVFVD